MVCTFDLAWQGPCGSETYGSAFCSKHHGLKCCCCGAQAVRECDATFALVCGALLCEGCHDTGTGAHVRTPRSKTRRGGPSKEEPAKSYWDRIREDAPDSGGRE